MNAPSDPAANQPPKRPVVGGRHYPPSEDLTGRSGACNILGIEKRELRRLEARGVLRPAVVQANGVRWFDIETVWRLAVERQKAGKNAQRRAPRRTRPEGVERVTGAETRQITAWFAAGLSHAEIVLQSGKTHETIRYLYAQYVTPSGARLRMTSPTARQSATEPAGYYPEHESAATTARPRLVGPLPKPPALSLPVPAPVQAATALGSPPATKPESSLGARRPLTQVPDSWFTAPLPPLQDDGD